MNAGQAGSSQPELPVALPLPRAVEVSIVAAFLTGIFAILLYSLVILLLHPDVREAIGGGDPFMALDAYPDALIAVLTASPGFIFLPLCAVGVPLQVLAHLRGWNVGRISALVGILLAAAVSVVFLGADVVLILFGLVCGYVFGLTFEAMRKSDLRSGLFR